MPSAPLVMRTAAGSAVSTPAADHAGLVFDSEAAIPGEPAWIDDGGTLRSLQGADGELTDFDAGTSGAAYEFDLADGNVQYLELDDDAAITFTGWPASSIGVLRVWFTQPGAGGPFAPSFGAEVDWGEPGEPDWSTTAGMTDVVDFQSRDGGTIVLASVSGRAGPPGTSDLDAIITASSGQDIADALAGAAAPDSGNVFATMADVGGGGGGITEIDYAEITSGVSITATSEATANTVITGSAVAYSGSQDIYVEFFTAVLEADGGAGDRFISVWLYDGSSSIGQIAFQRVQTSGNNEAPCFASRRLTPSAATHTYSIRANVNAGTGQVGAGAGGSGATMPAFMRILLVP